MPSNKYNKPYIEQQLSKQLNISDLIDLFRGISESELETEEKTLFHIKVCEKALAAQDQENYKEFYFIAFEKISISHIPVGIRNFAICCAAIIKKPREILTILRDLKDQPFLDQQEVTTLINIALDRQEIPITSIPKELLTENFLLFYIEKYPGSLPSIPEDKCSTQIYRKALKKEPSLVYSIVDKLPEEILIENIKNQSNLLRLIPVEKLTPLVCQEAIIQDPWNIFFLRQQLKTKMLEDKTYQCKAPKFTPAHN